MSVGLVGGVCLIALYRSALVKISQFLPRLKRTKLRHLRYTQHPEVFKCSLTHM